LSLSTLADKYCPSVCRPVLNRVQNSPIGKRIVSGTFWSLLGAAIARGCSFVSAVLIARNFGQETFGEYGFIRANIDSFSLFAIFGIGITTTKYLSELLTTDKERAGRIVAMSYLFCLFSGILIALLFFFIAPWLCMKINNGQHLVIVMRLGALLLFLSTLNSTQSGVMSGFQDFRNIAKTNMVTGILSIPLLLGGGFLYGLIGIFIGFIILLSCNILCNSFFIFTNKKKYQLKYDFMRAWREFPILWKYSLPAALSSFMIAPVLTGCYFLLMQQPNGVTEMSIFIVAMQYYLIVFFIPTQTSHVFLTLLSESNGTNNTKRFEKVFRSNIVLNIISVLFIIIPMIICSPYLMKLYGNSFQTGTLTLIVICLAVFPATIARSIDQVMASKGMMWSSFILSLFWACILFGVSYYLIGRSWGALGIASAYCLAYTIRIITVGIYFYCFGERKYNIDIKVQYFNSQK
jgi:O-antigen/teichoic acid export membrane protein